MPSASPTPTLRAVDFDRLVEQHYGSMKRMARTFVGSDAVAEEVVQDTWLAIVAGIDRFEGRSSLQTWMFSILTNTAKTRGARERRSTPLSCLGGREPDEPAIDADRFQSDDDAWPGHWATPPRPWQKPERRLLSLEARGHLKAALDVLPERQRLVVTLRDVEGFGADEVCELLDLSPENQRVLLHRGRTRLRATLEAYVEGV
jgi:RNA polymerase sigma-70 factor (ECF subfamily)